MLSFGFQVRPQIPTMASPAVSPDSSSHEGLSSVNSAPACSPTSDSENLSPDELELLAKLEEQNRLLEADSKSMRSMNGSRRNSGSSLVSSSSASSNLSHLEEDTWILWGRIVNEWDEWRKKKEKLLKELIRKGIPHHFRAIVWQLLCSATDMPVKNQYSELLKMSSPCEKLIRRDIARTYPEHEFFKGQDSLGQEVLFNVMKAYSLVDREVGYCQGSAFIVGLLLMQMPEEEAFCVFVRLMQEYRLRELFKPSMAELGLCIYQFEYMLQEQLPELNIHFRSQSFLTSMYASSWFLTLFLTTFPLPVATRVFDIFMYEGLEIVFRVGMALLQFNQAELVQLDMEGMSQVRLGWHPRVLQRNSLLPDEDNVVRLQEELQALALREAEAVKSLTELQQQVKELSDSWQVRPPESPPGFLGPFTSAWVPPVSPGPTGSLHTTRVVWVPSPGVWGPLLDTSIPFVATWVLSLPSWSPLGHFSPSFHCLDPLLGTWVSYSDIWVLHPNTCVLCPLPKVSSWPPESLIPMSGPLIPMSGSFVLSPKSSPGHLNPFSQCLDPLLDTWVSSSDIWVLHPNTWVLCPVPKVPSWPPESLIPMSGPLIPMSGCLIPMSGSFILSPKSSPGHLNPFSQCLDPLLGTWVSSSDIWVLHPNTWVLCPVPKVSSWPPGSLIPMSGCLIPMSGCLIPMSGSLVLSPKSSPGHLNPFSQCLDPLLDTWSGSLIQMSESLIPKFGSLIPVSGSLIPTSESFIPKSGSLIQMSESLIPVSGTGRAGGVGAELGVWVPYCGAELGELGVAWVLNWASVLLNWRCSAGRSGAGRSDPGGDSRAAHPPQIPPPSIPPPPIPPPPILPPPQGQIQRTVLGRAEQTCAGLREQLRLAAAQSKGLQAQLSESHRKHAEAQCKSKEEVMAVRLREADSMAALAEMRQRVAELEIQREEGMIQGQLNHSDAAQYIRQLKDHIDELKAEIRLLRGPLSFGAVGLGTRLGDEDSLGSSDEELPPFALPHGDIGDLGDLGDMGDSSDSETEGAPTAP
ncbi:EVI5-like protein [Phasianus colchicus]|uniref:EVI5-like protein n=1 Tax=Phasianus colchicus TaxID=9054 RepID=UPI00129E61F9|nr:EVI5-like protein [Phasianus colchicus]